MTANAQTLTQRLAAGRLPMNDALRYAVQIVDALRHAHEEGYCHGALTPDAVILTGASVELVPAQPGAVGALTPYTAPELLQGQAPDARTDIFSLGALLYEMFTGQRAFAGESAEELAVSIENSMPVPIGDTALDRLVLNCLVKDPAGRWQRVQQIHMEFKILIFSARRAQSAGLPRQPDAALQAELRQVESRLAVRLEQQFGEAAAGLRHLSAQLPRLESHLTARLEEQYGETTAALRHVAAELPLMESHLSSRLEQRCGEALADVRHLSAELPQMESRLTSRLEQHEAALAGVQQVAVELPQMELRLTSRLDQHDGALAGVHQAAAEQTSRLDAVSRTLTAVQEQIRSLESRLAAARECADRAQHAADELTEGAKREAASLEVSLAGQLHSLEATVKSHAAAIDSIRAAMARTDDFMERVVEALESLQTMVLDHARERNVA